MKTLLTVLVTIGAMIAGPAGAQVSCTEWNTHSFFKSATAADVTRCLAVGADLEVRDDKERTPLHWAAAYSETPAVITALLAAGADLKARDRIGNTPWDLARPASNSVLSRALQ